MPPCQRPVPKGPQLVVPARHGRRTERTPPGTGIPLPRTVAAPLAGRKRRQGRHPATPSPAGRRGGRSPAPGAAAHPGPAIPAGPCAVPPQPPERSARGPAPRRSAAPCTPRCWAAAPPPTWASGVAGGGRGRRVQGGEEPRLQAPPRHVPGSAGPGPSVAPPRTCAPAQMCRNCARWGRRGSHLTRQRYSSTSSTSATPQSGSLSGTGSACQIPKALRSSTQSSDSEE